MGSGNVQVFPRLPVDGVLGAPRSIVGRVDGSPPPSVTVRGELRGQPCVRTVEVASVRIADTREVALCNCKQTGGRPYCDGTHHQIKSSANSP